MKKSQFSDHSLPKMIRTLPERDVPAGLAGRIMREIYVSEQNVGKKVIRRLAGFVSCNVRTLRLVGAVCSLALVFWLGLTIGGHKHGTVDDGHDIARSLASASTNADADFFIGRGLLAAGLWSEAVPFLRKASFFVPNNPEYALWEGVALGKSGNKAGELDIYRKTVDRYAGYVPARLYLGHALLENGQPDAALTEYGRVLSLLPDTATAIYNSALAYHLLGQEEQEAAAWKEYLLAHRTGKWAYRAVEHLNELGDFTYRSYQIGFRRIIFNQKLLLGADSVGRQHEVDFLADSFMQASANVLNIVVFKENDIPFAGRNARNLKYFVSEHLAGTAEKSVNTSWFGQPERVRSPSGREFSLQEGLLIFSKPRVQKTEEKRI